MKLVAISSTLTITRKSLEKFLGRVFHAIKCTEGARRFTSRLLALFGRTSYGQQTFIDPAARADVRWLAEFLPKFNGVSIIKPTTAQLTVEVDACPTGAGGYIQDFGFYHFMFPSSIASLNLCIASLECFNILVAVRLWIKHWHGLVVRFFCDNSAAVCALNSGKANDPLLQPIVRELWLLVSFMTSLWLHATSRVHSW